MSVIAASDSISSSAKIEKSKRLRTASNQGSAVSTSQLYLRTLPSAATPPVASPNNTNSTSAINVLQTTALVLTVMLSR